jgi:hypothetical protein
MPKEKAKRQRHQKISPNVCRFHTPSASVRAVQANHMVPVPRLVDLPRVQACRGPVHPGTSAKSGDESVLLHNSRKKRHHPEIAVPLALASKFRNVRNKKIGVSLRPIAPVGYRGKRRVSLACRYSFQPLDVAEAPDTS